MEVSYKADKPHVAGKEALESARKLEAPEKGHSGPGQHPKETE